MAETQTIRLTDADARQVALLQMMLQDEGVHVELTSERDQDVWRVLAEGEPERLEPKKREELAQARREMAELQERQTKEREELQERHWREREQRADRLGLPPAAPVPASGAEPERQEPRTREELAQAREVAELQERQTKEREELVSRQLRECEQLANRLRIPLDALLTAPTQSPGAAAGTFIASDANLVLINLVSTGSALAIAKVVKKWRERVRNFKVAGEDEAQSAENVVPPAPDPPSG
jgi:hypothetical protein